MQEKNQSEEHIGFLVLIGQRAAQVTDVTNTINNIMQHPHQEDDEKQAILEELEFQDDVTDSKLNHDLARKAR